MEHIPPPSDNSYFTEQAPRAAYMAPANGRTHHEYVRDHHPNHHLPLRFPHPHPHPHPYLYPPSPFPNHPHEIHEAIQRQIEKEKIREEIIMSEIARRHALEAEVRRELMVEREFALRRGIDGFSFTSSPVMELSGLGTRSEGRSTEERFGISLEEWENLVKMRKSADIDTMPFQRRTAGLRISEVKPGMEGSEEKRVILLAKPDESPSGSKRKALLPPGLDPTDISLDSIARKRAKEEWSCALCQVSASSEQGLNEHLQGRRHKSKEAALRAQRVEKNYSIGLFPKKVPKPNPVYESIDPNLDCGVIVKTVHLPLKRAGEARSKRDDPQTLPENLNSDVEKKLPKVQKTMKVNDSEKDTLNGEQSSKRDDLRTLHETLNCVDLKQQQSEVKKILINNYDSEKRDLKIKEGSSKRKDLQTVRQTCTSDDSERKQSEVQEVLKNSASEKVLKLGEVSSNDGYLQPLEESQNTGNLKKKESEVQKVQKNDGLKEESFHFFCEVCQLKIYYPKEVDQHLMGKKHARRVKCLSRSDQIGGVAPCTEGEKTGIVCYHADGAAEFGINVALDNSYQLMMLEGLEPMDDGAIRQHDEPVTPVGESREEDCEAVDADKTELDLNYDKSEPNGQEMTLQPLQLTRTSDDLARKQSEVQKVLKNNNSEKVLKIGEVSSKTMDLQPMQQTQTSDGLERKKLEAQNVLKNNDSEKKQLKIGESSSNGGYLQPLQESQNSGNLKKKESEAQKVQKNEKKLLKIGEASSNSGYLQPSQEIQNPGNLKKKESEVQNVQKNIISKKESFQFFCEICQVKLHFLRNVDEHLMGKKHARNVELLSKSGQTGGVAPCTESEKTAIICDHADGVAEVGRTVALDNTHQLITLEDLEPMDDGGVPQHDEPRIPVSEFPKEDCGAVDADKPELDLNNDNFELNGQEMTLQPLQLTQSSEDLERKQSEVQKVLKNSDPENKVLKFWEASSQRTDLQPMQQTPTSDVLERKESEAQKVLKNNDSEKELKAGEASSNRDYLQPLPKNLNPGNLKINASHIQKVQTNDGLKKKGFHFFCEICQLKFFCSKSVDIHLMGKKHARRVKRLGQSDQTGGAAPCTESEKTAVLGHHAKGVGEVGGTVTLDNAHQFLELMMIDVRVPIDSQVILQNVENGIPGGESQAEDRAIDEEKPEHASNNDKFKPNGPELTLRPLKETRNSDSFVKNQLQVLKKALITRMSDESKRNYHNIWESYSEREDLQPLQEHQNSDDMETKKSEVLKAQEMDSKKELKIDEQSSRRDVLELLQESHNSGNLKKQSKTVPKTGGWTKKGFCFWCETCEMGFRNPKTVDFHLMGRRHARNVELLGKSDQIDGVASCTERKNTAETSYNTKGADTHGKALMSDNTHQTSEQQRLKALVGTSLERKEAEVRAIQKNYTSIKNEFKAEKPSSKHSDIRQFLDRQKLFTWRRQPLEVETEQKNDTSTKKEFEAGEIKLNEVSLQRPQKSRNPFTWKREQPEIQTVKRNDAAKNKQPLEVETEQKNDTSTKKEFEAGEIKLNEVSLQRPQKSQNPFTWPEIQTVKRNDVAKKKERSKLWCEICQVGAPGRKIMNKHRLGKKHVKRFKNLYKTTGTLPQFEPYVFKRISISPHTDKQIAALPHPAGALARDGETVPFDNVEHNLEHESLEIQEPLDGVSNVDKTLEELRLEGHEPLDGVGNVDKTLKEPIRALPLEYFHINFSFSPSAEHDKTAVSHPADGVAEDVKAATSSHILEQPRLESDVSMDNPIKPEDDKLTDEFQAKHRGAVDASEPEHGLSNDAVEPKRQEPTIS